MKAETLAQHLESVLSRTDIDHAHNGFCVVAFENYRTILAALRSATALEQVRKDALEPVLEQARDIVTNHRAWIAKHPNRAAECLESALGTLDLLVAHYNLKDQANG